MCNICTRVYSLCCTTAGFVRAPSAVYMKQPGARAQEDIKAVLLQETANGLSLEDALYVAGKLTSISSCN